MKEQDAVHSFEKFEGHTPGPWKIITRKPVGVMRDIYTISPNGRFEYNICEITNSLGVNTEANANLVAAAPSLLAELTRLRSELQQKDELHDDLRDRCALQMEQDARRIAQLIQLFIDVTGVHPDDFKSKAK